MQKNKKIFYLLIGLLVLVGAAFTGIMFFSSSNNELSELEIKKRQALIQKEKKVKKEDLKIEENIHEEKKINENISKVEQSPKSAEYIDISLLQGSVGSYLEIQKELNKYDLENELLKKKIENKKLQAQLEQNPQEESKQLDEANKAYEALLQQLEMQKAVNMQQQELQPAPPKTRLVSIQKISGKYPQAVMNIDGQIKKVKYGMVINGSKIVKITDKEVVLANGVKYGL